PGVHARGARDAQRAADAGRPAQHRRLASRVRRLGTFLTTREDLLAVLRVLDATPAPRGRELATALALREHCRSHWPAIDWQVQRVGSDGANLVAAHDAGPLLYSHLDTSLDPPADVGALR